VGALPVGLRGGVGSGVCPAVRCSLAGVAGPMQPSTVGRDVVYECSVGVCV
jgi:hypothetical protein